VAQEGASGERGEHCDESSGFVRGRGFFDQLGDYQLQRRTLLH
jgi:hypothetical protein